MFKNRNRITKTIRKKSISADGDESKYYIRPNYNGKKKRNIIIINACVI